MSNPLRQPPKFKQIDAGPNGYRKQDPQTGRWKLPDDPKLARTMFFVSLMMLAVLWFWRGTSNDVVEFLAPVIVAFGAGGTFAIWLKDVD